MFNLKVLIQISSVLLGKPAYEMLETDPDWVPSLYLGLTDGNIRRTERVPPTTTYERQHKHRKTTDTRPSDPQTESESEADQDGDGETPQAPPAGGEKCGLHQIKSISCVNRC